MLIGFGCTVPAVMATRTLSSRRDRRMTILLTPFMSCSAKLPIYAVFAAAFFPHNQALAMTLIYIFGMCVGVACGLILNKTTFRGNPVPFVMELPNYRFPSAKSVALLMWDKAKDFIQRAFTIIFLGTLIIWFLETFNYQFNVVANSEMSLLGTLGRFISPLFAPMGFGDWRSATALISGFTAKEAVISTLAILTESSVEDLPAMLGALFTPASATAFLAFTLLYTPCFAAIAAIKREMGSAKHAFYIVLFQCGVAWAVSLVVYQVARLVM
jgi:ferrous iron transport protein B